MITFENSQSLKKVKTRLFSVILLVIVPLRQKATIDECGNHNLRIMLNMIAPIQLGVDSWQIGDYARYRYERKLSSDEKVIIDRSVGFHIVDELEKSGFHGYWLKKTGFAYFRDVPIDFYRYVTVHDLRISPQNPIYEFTRNYVPFNVGFCVQTTSPLAQLVKLGKEVIETEAGAFDCIHYRVDIGKQRNHRTLEIWTSAAISPLGIVRVQSQTEMMELISFGKDPEITVPKIFQPVIDGTSTLKRGCTSCHGSPCHELISPPL